MATLRTCSATLAVLLVASAAAAQTHLGVRAGVSGDPTQFVFGGHVETSPLIEHLTFRPNVEVGVGDHTTLVALNVEFVYSIPLSHQPWRVYLGGGPAANLYSYSAGSGRSDGSTVSGGFNFLVGVQHERGLFTELKVGAIHSPTVKVTFGYAFR